MFRADHCEHCKPKVGLVTDDGDGLPAAFGSCAQIVLGCARREPLVNDRGERCGSSDCVGGFTGTQKRARHDRVEALPCERCSERRSILSPTRRESAKLVGFPGGCFGVSDDN